MFFFIGSDDHPGPAPVNLLSWKIERFKTQSRLASASSVKYSAGILNWSTCNSTANESNEHMIYDCKEVAAALDLEHSSRMCMRDTKSLPVP
jgi:hypothetical protein